MKVLISSGATRELIDGVRYLTNFSTGTTGAVLADKFYDEGFDVDYLCGISAERPSKPVTITEFGDFKDLDTKIKKILMDQTFHVIVHLAAVSDYSVKAIEIDGQLHFPEKLPKIDSGKDISLKLTKNHKILERLKTYATANTTSIEPVIIGFKLTNTKSPIERGKAIMNLSEHDAVDIVVHNDVHDIKPNSSRRFTIYEKGEYVAECSSRTELARELIVRTNEAMVRKGIIKEGNV